MSGGSRNYICYKIENELCGQMYDDELNDLMEDIQKLAHDVEWLDSSDIGEDDYMKTVAEFKQKWFKGDRQTRLKSYIDRQIEDIRKKMYALIGEDTT